jgi:ABC-2 type transport system permease protein
MTITNAVALAQPQRLGQWQAFGAVLRYEFLMQIRRVTFWVIFAVGAIVPVIQFFNPQNFTHDANLAISQHSVIVIEITDIAGFVALATGLLLAGRVQRDRSLRVEEILKSARPAPMTRLFGKYAGATLASFVPAALLTALGTSVLVARYQDFSVIPLALAVAALTIIPATLFVGAFAIACGTFMWAPLFQFLFLGYWLWEQLDPKGPIPTLNGTILSPSMRLVMTGIFGFTPFRTSDLSYYPTVGAVWGIANIAALIGVGLLALVLAGLYQQSRTTRD